METLLQDVRYALRMLGRNPGVTFVAVLCLSLGIGVNSTIFSIVDGVVLRPFPFHDPDRLVGLYETQQQNGVNRGPVSYQDLRDWQEQAHSFSAIGATTMRSLTLVDGTEPERLIGATVTANLFPMLGIEPVLGRPFRADEDRPGAAGAVLLGYDLWQRRYHGDPHVIGRSILINDVPSTIVGVMPPKFAFPERMQLWIPMAPIEHASARSERDLQVFARLRPGVTVDQARQELTQIAAGIARAHPGQSQGWSATVRSLNDVLLQPQVKLMLFTMLGAVTLVLLIACANVANLLLARAAARRREMAVRAALGAGRLRIVRQLLTESILIGLLSVPAGIGLAYLGLHLFNASIPPQQQPPYFMEWHIDLRVLLYTIGVAVVTGVVFGLAPAVQAARDRTHDDLKEGSRGAGGGRNRLRGGLVVAEIALSLVLLVGASLFVRSFLNLQATPAGFDTGRLMTLRIYMPDPRYTPAGARTLRVDDIVRRVEALPGVVSAMASNLVPIGGGGDFDGAVVEGRAVRAGEAPRIYYTGVTPHFLKTIGVRLLRGRDFTDREGTTRSGVAIVNETLAKRLWPAHGRVPAGADAVGSRFRLAGDTSGQWIQVIGVVPDFYLFGVQRQDPISAAFLPYPYMETPNTGVTIRVAGGSPATVTGAVRQQIRQSDPTLPIFEAESADALADQAHWADRLFGWMFGIFGVIALVLAAVGVYGVLSFSVSQRIHEIGVRVALGAGARDVLGLVVGQGLRLAAIGAALGLAGAAGAAQVIRSVLFNVQAIDPISFAGTTAFLTAVALVASVLPARRAARIDPVVALREE
ncbi:MAG: ABC transporter permease [Acidobacteriota bacterium]|nr:ABC transporter permease [Acidobacteriota bacterium]